MWFLLICLLWVGLVIGIRFYENKQQKIEGYLLKVRSKVNLEGFKNEKVTIKIYSDKITFNDLATMRIEKVTKVSEIREFINHKGDWRRNRVYISLPYFHEIYIHYITNNGNKNSVLLVKEGKTTKEFILLRNLLLKLIGKEEKPKKPFQPPFNPYEL
ncbi:hypothetical protein [Peribacillus frigoritolerans]|uniref:hypothetical protein n=1 Tax=Peribacillus frigoritolerans TaxID=450367 RepID=UPI0039A16EE7